MQPWVKSPISSVKSGVNIMRDRKTTLILIVWFLIPVLFGCGGNDEATSELPGEDNGMADSTKVDDRSDDWKEIEKVIDETIVRLRYRDKSGLYENEFEYLRDEENLDQYVKHGEVIWANADSLERVEINDIRFFERDSAWIQVTFHFMGASGKEHISSGKLNAYYHHGRWIKPYMSTYVRQMEYEELIRQADEDTEG